MAEKRKRKVDTTRTFRTPFSAFGNDLVDGLFYTVAHFSENERINGEKPAEVIADALNTKFGLKKED